MKVLLVKPPQKTNEIQPPLGLGYLASTIKDFAEVEILDCIKENYSTKDFERFLHNKKYDFVGLQCYTVDLNTVKKLVNITKKILPKAKTIVGGPQPSLDPINTLRYLDADYVFCGEAEIGFPMLIKGDKLEKIPGLIYKNKINPNKLVENLDDYQIGWEFFDLKSYPLAPHGAFCKQYPTAPLIITRGCPFQCTYCGAHLISGRRIRSHSVNYTIKQIEFLNKIYGIKEIHIEDDNFTTNKNYVIEFCNKLIKRDLGITFTFPNGIRLDTLDKGLINLMKRAGLYSVSVGIESGSDRILDLMNKRLKTGTIREKINLLSKGGIEIIGFFIVGYPGETKQEILKTIKFAKSLKLKRATFSAFKPFPGTLIYNELIKKGKIKELKWENFSLDKIAWSPKGISVKQLKNLRRRAFLEFYLRPRILLKMLSEIKNFQNFKFITIRIFRWLT